MKPYPGLITHTALFEPFSQDSSFILLITPTQRCSPGTLVPCSPCASTLLTAPNHLEELRRQIPLFTAEPWIRKGGISQMVCGLCDDMIVIHFNSLSTLLDSHSPDSAATIKLPEKVNTSLKKNKKTPHGPLVQTCFSERYSCFIARLKDTLKIDPRSCFPALSDKFFFSFC